MKVKNDAEKVKRKFGFIFFNDYLYLAGDCTTNNFSIAVHKDSSSELDILKRLKPNNKNNIQNISF